MTNNVIEVNTAKAIKESKQEIKIRIEDDILGLEQLTSIINCIAVAQSNTEEVIASEDVQNSLQYIYYAQKNILDNVMNELRA